jgi:ATP-dependent RNA helicase DDX19/DBP5
MSTPTAAPASLADRITKAPAAAPALDAKSTSFTPANSGPTAAASWADEVASPTVPSDRTVIPSLGDAQIDGAAPPLGGSGLHDATYEVEVDLSQIQGDKTSPLYSVNSFEELGM